MWLLSFALLCFQPSDVRLEGVRLDAFTTTRGMSEVGTNILVTIPAKSFAVAKCERRGAATYLWKRVTFVVRSNSAALAEVRRRGGNTRVRGKVLRTSAAEQARGAPPCVVIVSELAYARR